MMDAEDKKTEGEAWIETPAQAEAADEASPKTITGNRTMAMLCHLLSFISLIGIPFGNILGPLVLWLIKKKEDPLVDATGKEVLNFQISVTIYAIVCVFLSLVIIGLVLLPILLIIAIVYTIIGATKADEGQLYRYPFSIRFIK